MTIEQIKQECAGLVKIAALSKEPQRTYEAFAYSLLLRAYEEAAQVADQVEKEDDQFAQEQGLPSDHGGNPEYARRIRALKEPLDKDPTVQTPAVL